MKREAKGELTKKKKQKKKNILQTKTIIEKNKTKKMLCNQILAIVQQETGPTVSDIITILKKNKTRISKRSVNKELAQLVSQGMLTCEDGVYKMFDQIKRLDSESPVAMKNDPSPQKKRKTTKRRHKKKTTSNPKKKKKMNIYNYFTRTRVSELRKSVGKKDSIASCMTIISKEWKEIKASPQVLAFWKKKFADAMTEPKEGARPLPQLRVKTISSPPLQSSLHVQKSSTVLNLDAMDTYKCSESPSNITLHSQKNEAVKQNAADAGEGEKSEKDTEKLSEESIAAQPGEVVQADEARADELQADEAQVDEVQSGEVQSSEAQSGEAQSGEVQADEVQADEVQADEVQVDEVQADEVRADEAQVDAARADEVQENEAQEDDVAQANESKETEGSPDQQIYEASECTRVNPEEPHEETTEKQPAENQEESVEEKEEESEEASGLPNPNTEESANQEESASLAAVDGAASEITTSEVSSVEPWMFTNVFGKKFETVTSLYTTEKWQNMCTWT